MTAQPHASVFRSNEDIEDFCTLRSKLIDEFARLELAVNRCLCTLGLMPDARKTTLSYRITELSKAKPSAHISKTRSEALRSLPKRCEKLQRLRASVVHGVMELGSCSGEQIVLFRNVADIIAKEPVGLVLTRTDFQQKIEEVREMACEVERSLNKPITPART